MNEQADDDLVSLELRAKSGRNGQIHYVTNTGSKRVSRIECTVIARNIVGGCDGQICCGDDTGPRCQHRRRKR